MRCHNLVRRGNKIIILWPQLIKAWVWDPNAWPRLNKAWSCSHALLSRGHDLIISFPRLTKLWPCIRISFPRVNKAWPRIIFIYVTRRALGVKGLYRGKPAFFLMKVFDVVCKVSTCTSITNTCIFTSLKTCISAPSACNSLAPPTHAEVIRTVPVPEIQHLHLTLNINSILQWCCCSNHERAGQTPANGCRQRKKQAEEPNSAIQAFLMWFFLKEPMTFSLKTVFLLFPDQYELSESDPSTP